MGMNSYKIMQELFEEIKSGKYIVADPKNDKQIERSNQWKVECQKRQK